MRHKMKSWTMFMFGVGRKKKKREYKVTPYTRIRF